MPELPEITVISRQMNKEIRGKRIQDIEAKQPKNLNMPVAKFVKTAKSKVVTNVSSKGKWLFIKLDPAYYMLINRGMNADLLYFTPNQKPPEKHQFKLTFSDKTGFTIQFQWFGYIHIVPEKELTKHKLTGRLGISPTDEEFTLERFRKLLANRKTRIKNFLLNQKNIAGIGNVYIQDILFKAKLHPNQKISTLSQKEIANLHNAIQTILNRSIQLRGRPRKRLLRTKRQTHRKRIPRRLQNRKTMPHMQNINNENQNRKHILIHLPKMPTTKTTLDTINVFIRCIQLVSKFFHVTQNSISLFF